MGSSTVMATAGQSTPRVAAPLSCAAARGVRSSRPLLGDSSESLVAHQEEFHKCQTQAAVPHEHIPHGWLSRGCSSLGSPKAVRSVPVYEERG